nr:MAG TPA: hypothetical protein [Caudoviricetes sp.]
MRLHGYTVTLGFTYRGLLIVYQTPTLCSSIYMQKCV